MHLNYKNLELILIDNCSRDESVKFVKNNYKNVKILQLKKNYGFAKGNNIGASKAKGEYIVLLNNDTCVNKNWLIELVKEAKTSDEIGILGSKIYYYDQMDIINYAGGICTKLGNTSHFGTGLKDNKIINIKRETFFVCGAALLIKREVFEKFRLFDPKYFAYYEDVDLCWRSWILGYKVMYVPKSFIYHKVGTVLGKNFPRRLFLIERNRLRTLLKNYEYKTLIKILPGYILWRIFRIWHLIRKSDKLAYLFFLTYIKAFIWNLFHLRSLLKNRKKIQFYRKKDDKFLLQLIDKFVKFI